MSFVAEITQDAFPVQGTPPYLKQHYATNKPIQPFIPYTPPIPHTDFTYRPQKIIPPSPVTSTCSSTSQNTENEQTVKQGMSRSFTPSLVVRRTSASKCMSLSDMSIIPLDDPVPEVPAIPESRVWRLVNLFRRNLGRVWGSLSAGVLTIFEIMSNNTVVEQTVTHERQVQVDGNWV